MRGKLWFIGGMAAGFVLGARAGREKYEELVVKGRKILDHPTVQEAAGVAQAQANRLYSEGKDRLSQSRLGEKLSTSGPGSSSDTTAVLSSTSDNLASSTAGTGRSTSTGSTSSAGSSSANRPKNTPGPNGSTL